MIFSFPANVWTDERIISTNSTLENIYFKIFKTSRDLIGNTITEPILEENKKVMIGNVSNVVELLCIIIYVYVCAKYLSFDYNYLL
jgi:hypothetical protein